MNILHKFKPNLNNNKKALINIGYTIENLCNIFDTKLIKKIYEGLTYEQKKNQSFLANFFCNNLGKYYPIRSICICHVGFFRNHCQNKLVDFIGVGKLIAYRVIFSIISAIPEGKVSLKLSLTT